MMSTTSRTLRRWVRELRHVHADADVQRSLASLFVCIDGDRAIVSRKPHGVPLFDARTRVQTVTVEPKVYATTPTAEARVRLLAAAASLGREIHVHAPNTIENTFRGRLGIDVPRRIMRALRLPAAEPGDRWADDFSHAFFDDEAIVLEATCAGLRVARREGGFVVLEHGVGEREDVDPFVAEVARVLVCVVHAERLRVGETPERAVTTMRSRGRQASARGVTGRARLRRAIAWVDAVFPGGPNCFRRVLAEVGLDGGAASETLVFGLDVGAGESGHVAFKGAEDRAFDVAFEIR